MKKRRIMMKKNLLQKADKNPILRGSKVPCLEPPKPMPDPKNQKNEKLMFSIIFGLGAYQPGGSKFWLEYPWMISMEILAGISMDDIIHG